MLQRNKTHSWRVLYWSQSPPGVYATYLSISDKASLWWAAGNVKSPLKSTSRWSTLKHTWTMLRRFFLFKTQKTSLALWLQRQSATGQKLVLWVGMVPTAALTDWFQTNTLDGPLDAGSLRGLIVSYHSHADGTSPTLLMSLEWFMVDAKKTTTTT